MKHHRKVNPNHVDLNRNFVFDGKYSPAINPDYDVLMKLLNPSKTVGTLGAESIPFLAKASKSMIYLGKGRVQADPCWDSIAIRGVIDQEFDLPLKKGADWKRIWRSSSIRGASVSESESPMVV